MKQENYVCIQGSPLVPKWSTAKKVFDQSDYGASIYGVYPPNHPEEYGGYYPICRLTREQVEQNPECWKRQSDECVSCNQSLDRQTQKSYCQTCLTIQSGMPPKPQPTDSAEQKCQESMAKRFEFIPAYGKWHWRCDDENNKAIHLNFYGDDPTTVAMWNIGNCHATKKAAEEWGVAYAQYFQIPNQD